MGDLTQPSEFGKLIEGTEEDFKSFCSDKDLGYLSSFHNFLVMTYNQLQEMKNDLVKKMKKEGQTEEAKIVLEGLYDKLFRVEARVFIVRDIVEDLKSKSLSGHLTLK